MTSPNMSKPGLSFGLNLAKKSGPAKPAPPKRKPMFGGEDDSDDDNGKPDTSNGTAITELDDDFSSASISTKQSTSRKASQKSKNGNSSQQPPPPPQRSDKNKKSQMTMYGDLSSALESRRYQEAAEELDPSVYDYDGVYDSMKPGKRGSGGSKAQSAEDAERRPKYMKSLLASAAVRKRDALIAEEKKIARERELEGDEFADKDKFVTEAYKKQQEENRRLEEEERRREEEEAEKNKGGGMTAFYKDLLEREDRKHAESVQAAEKRAKEGPRPGAEDDDEESREEKARTDADLAREMNQKGADIAINEDGQVVDQRELLKGGLNLGAAKKPEVKRDTDKNRDSRDDRYQSRGQFAPGGKQAMRERQTRMLEAQLEQSLKRSLQEEEEERQKIERAAKSRKTDSEISSAKERYLARKRAAEEAKKQGQS